MTGAVEKTIRGTILAQVTYTYDALDNRIGMDENGTQTWTLYDGSDPIMDFNSSGSLEMRYLNGPTGDLVDTVLARESAGGTIAWYLPDRLGTIRDLISNSGAIIDHVDYSAFGTVLDESSPSSGDRMMGFAGMERDTVTGLNLAVNRVQNPGTGRWTSQDPLEFKSGDVDLYIYTINSPATFVDPSGAFPIPIRLRNPYYRPPGTRPPPPGDIIRSPDGGKNQPVGDTMLGDWDRSCNTGKEYGGWIFWNPDDGSLLTWPVPPGKKRGKIHFGYPPIIPGYFPIAIWHTHPGPIAGPVPPSPWDRDHLPSPIGGFIIGGPTPDCIWPY